MLNSRTRGLINQLAGHAKIGARLVERCAVGDVPGGAQYTMPFESLAIPAVGGTVTLDIKPKTTQGFIPVAIILDSGIPATLRVTRIEGPDENAVGIHGANGSAISDEWELTSFQDRMILTSGYISLPPSIGKLMPDQGLKITFQNDAGAATQDVRGQLVGWVPSKDAALQNNYMDSGALINQVRAAYHKECNGGFPPGVYPIPFRHSVPIGAAGEVVSLRPSIAGGLIPLQMKLSDNLPASLTINQIKGPNGNRIGLKGDDVSDSWDVDGFQDWEQVHAGLSNLPTNIGAITASRGLDVFVDSTSAAIEVFNGTLYVFNPDLPADELIVT